MVFNLLVLLLQRTSVSIHLTLLGLVTLLPTLLQQIHLMLALQDQVVVEVEVPLRHQHQSQPQVQQVVVALRRHLNDQHQYSHRLLKDQHIRWVDIWLYMMVQQPQQLRNQQLQLDQCSEHLRV